MIACRCEDNRPHMILSLAMLLILVCPPGTSVAQPTAQPVHAYYLKRMPAEYRKQEALIASLKNTGANAVILELPMNDQGFPDLGGIPDAVYLVHQAGLKLHVVLPTRHFPGMVSRHKEWEDARYDLGSGTVQPTGKLDLFNREALAYVSSLAAEIASFSVDALLLDMDFYYAPVEGIGPAAREQALIELQWAPDPRMLFQKVSRGPEGLIIERYGEYYGKWTALKRDRLLNVFDEIRKACRSVKADMKIGIPIPVIMPVSTEEKVFTQFAYDMSAFQKRNSDYYWTAIDYRDIKSQQNLTYRETRERIARMAHSAVTTVKLPDQVILVLPATTETGAMLPMSEIEETAKLAGNLPETGIAFIIGTETTVNRTFMKKMFRRQAQP